MLPLLTWSLSAYSMFPKSTHETFAQKLYQTFKDHKRFIKPKLARSDFTIVHYAGEVSLILHHFYASYYLSLCVSPKWCYFCTSFQVQYQSEQFIDKNKDYVVPEHQDMLSTSKCSFVSGLFPPLSEETAKSAKFSSIGSRFKVSKIWFFTLSGRNILSDKPYYNWKINTVILICAATITTTDGDAQSDRASLY